MIPPSIFTAFIISIMFLVIAFISDTEFLQRLIDFDIVQFLHYFSIPKYYTFQYSQLYVTQQQPIISQVAQYFYLTGFSSILLISLISHIFYHNFIFMFGIFTLLLLFMISIITQLFLSSIRYLHVHYRNVFKLIVVCSLGNWFIVRGVLLSSITPHALHYAQCGVPNVYFWIIPVTFIFWISLFGIIP